MQQPPRERLLALDVFRGLTVAAMLLVNNPGTWSAIYAPLGHATWHGWTPTDLIFPFFLFIVGITTHLSLEKSRDSRKVIRRGLLIVLFGLLLNAFPFFWWGKIADNADPTFIERVLYRFEHLRFPGVLQRIGIVYLCTGWIALRTTRRQQLGIAGALLVGYWLVMTLVPVPGTGTIGAMTLDQPDQTLAAWVDRLLLGPNHIWSSTKTWDPEGPLSTLPAIGTALLGLVAGAWLAERDRPLENRIVGLYAWGSLGLVGGWLWGGIFPINKNLWTSSYVLFTAGFAAVALATCLWLIDVRGWKSWPRPLVPFGVNPMLAFLGSGIMARLIGSLIKFDRGGKKVSLQQVTFEWVQASWMEPKFASLLWGLAFVAFWWAILEVLYRRRLILKV